MTLDLHSWGFRHNLPLNDVIKIEKLLEQIITTVSLGGNILINIGPTSQGIIKEYDFNIFKPQNLLMN